MDKKQILEDTIEHVKKYFDMEPTGHDWWHSYRVWKMSKHLAKYESCDSFIVELAALLHDIGDHKFHQGDYTRGPKEVKKYLLLLGLDDLSIESIRDIVETISFSKGLIPSSVEGKIVQDADRLDALGAIGIARAFAYGGYAKREIYNPGEKELCFSPKKGSTINHFYDKLLRLKDSMHTKTAKKIAERRHLYMLNYLENFFIEWEGRDEWGKD